MSSPWLCRKERWRSPPPNFDFPKEAFVQILPWGRVLRERGAARAEYLGLLTISFLSAIEPTVLELAKIYIVFVDDVVFLWRILLAIKDIW